jgi:hypothetical protein
VPFPLCSTAARNRAAIHGDFLAPTGIPGTGRVRVGDATGPLLLLNDR